MDPNSKTKIFQLEIQIFNCNFEIQSLEFSLVCSANFARLRDIMTDIDRLIPLKSLKVQLENRKWCQNLYFTRLLAETS